MKWGTGSREFGKRSALGFGKGSAKHARSAAVGLLLPTARGTRGQTFEPSVLPKLLPPWRGGKSRPLSPGQANFLRTTLIAFNFILV